MCFLEACHVMSQVLLFNNLRTWTQLEHSRTDEENHFEPGLGNPPQEQTRIGSQGLFLLFLDACFANGYRNTTRTGS